MDEFINAYTRAFQRFADFSGRTSRGGFWRFVAVNFAVSILLSVLVQVSGVFLLVQVVYLLALIIPSIAIAVRRLHDTGKSGWFLLVGFIPFVGFLVLIFFYVQESDGPNEYGPAAQD